MTPSKLDAAGNAFLVARETINNKIDLVAYKIKDDVWTIGIGMTYYPDGRKVKAGDKYPNVKAAIDDFLLIVQRDFATPVYYYFKAANLNQSMFNALVSYSYNRGFPRASQTALFKMISANPIDERIYKQFEIDWGTNATYKNALIARRKLEAALYFTETLTSKKKIVS